MYVDAARKLHTGVLSFINFRCHAVCHESICDDRRRGKDVQACAPPIWGGACDSLATGDGLEDDTTTDLTRTVSRHTLAYVLCSISELFRHYQFDPLDLLIIHAVLNANVLSIMRDPKLDRQYGSVSAVEPDDIKQGVSRGALGRFLNLPDETVRRRVDRLKKQSILTEREDGLVVTEKNQFKFGNNHELQQANLVFVRKLLKDLARAGIRSAEDI